MLATLCLLVLADFCGIRRVDGGEQLIVQRNGQETVVVDSRTRAGRTIRHFDLNEAGTFVAVTVDGRSLEVRSTAEPQKILRTAEFEGYTWIGSRWMAERELRAIFQKLSIDDMGEVRVDDVLVVSMNVSDPANRVVGHYPELREAARKGLLWTPDPSLAVPESDKGLGTNVTVWPLDPEGRIILFPELGKSLLKVGADKLDSYDWKSHRRERVASFPGLTIRFLRPLGSLACFTLVANETRGHPFRTYTDADPNSKETYESVWFNVKDGSERRFPGISAAMPIADCQVQDYSEASLVGSYPAMRSIHGPMRSLTLTKDHGFTYSYGLAKPRRQITGTWSASGRDVTLVPDVQTAATTEMRKWSPNFVAVQWGKGLCLVPECEMPAFAVDSRGPGLQCGTLLPVLRQSSTPDEA